MTSNEDNDQSKDQYDAYIFHKEEYEYMIFQVYKRNQDRGVINGTSRRDNSNSLNKLDVNNSISLSNTAKTRDKG